MTQIGGIWMNEDVKNDPKKVAEICEYFARQIDEMNLSYYYQHYPNKKYNPNNTSQE